MTKPIYKSLNFWTSFLGVLGSIIIGYQASGLEAAANDVATSAFADNTKLVSIVLAVISLGNIVYHAIKNKSISLSKSFWQSKNFWHNVLTVGGAVFVSVSASEVINSLQGVVEAVFAEKLQWSAVVMAVLTVLNTVWHLVKPNKKA